jgi:hypothetical protein
MKKREVQIIALDNGGFMDYIGMDCKRLKLEVSYEEDILDCGGGAVGGGVGGGGAGVGGV